MVRLRHLALWLAITAAALPTGTPGWAQAGGGDPPRLPSLGEPDSGDLTEGAERRIGELIMRQVRRDRAYFDDPLLLSHVQALWAPLVRAARDRGEIVPDTEGLFAWETFLIRDKSINAFALPGGFVGVHLGLMAHTVAQDELAAVLAHELAHVTQRHIARSNSQARRQSVLSMATMLLGVLVAARANSADMAQAAMMGSQAAAIQGQLNFSRDMEREADRVGFSILTDAGFAPGGAAAMFERLDKANRLNDSGNFPYLRSHPLTIERIGEARARAEAQEALQGQARGAAGQTVVVTGQFLHDPLPPPQVHLLMRARARVLMDTTEPALRHWQRAADGEGGGEERLGLVYSAALASMLLADHGRAERLLGELQAARLHAAARPAVDILAAEAAMASRRAARALQILETMDPRQRPVRLARADAALQWVQQAGDARERAMALQALKQHTDALSTWVIDRPRDALAWSQLSNGLKALGEPLRALRSEAEARWALGDLNGALDRLKAGQRMVRSNPRPDHVEASVIDARLRQLERERRRAFADMRGVREEDLPPVLPPNVPL